jgi:dipeptidyl aminopeptidase/acylaminoacyl peptidase
MRADGSEERQLTFASQSSRSPSFSPDGRTLVFTRDGAGGSGIWTMNADGSGTADELVPGSASADLSDPSYSPDGQRIVFASFGGGTSDVFTVNADGSDQQPVAATTAFEVEPTFSPDGTKVAYVRGSGDLYLADPDGGNQAPIPTENQVYPESSITWQPLNPPTCDLGGEAKQKSLKRVALTVTCANENAAATITGTGTAKRPKRAEASKRKKKFEIPALGAEVPQGTPATVTLEIPKRGRRLLRRGGKKGKVALSAAFSDGLGATSEDSLRVKLKKK